jgi:hypothetical protein
LRRGEEGQLTYSVSKDSSESANKKEVLRKKLKARGNRGLHVGFISARSCHRHQRQEDLLTSLSTPPQLRICATLFSRLAIEAPIPAEMASTEVSGAGKKPGPKPLQSSSPKKQYLILYNFVSAILWLTVLGRVLILVPLVGFGRVYPGVGQFTKWTQSLALLEVVHALFGELNAPPTKD